MKKVKLHFIVGLLLFAFILALGGCDKELFCEGRGELTVTNRSLHTVQRILIDGTNYGTLDPDESMTVELAVGKYTLQFQGISGGSGCSPSEVTIDACGTEGRVCRY